MIRMLADRVIFPIAYGAMALSIKGRPPERKAITTIHAALEAGMTLIDTADVYCRGEKELGHNERLVGKALASWTGTRPMVATKGGCKRPNGRWRNDGRPEHLREACEASLAALGVEQIDLYQLHKPDPEVPITESIGELTRLVNEGKIAHIGVSNFTLEQLETARSVAAIASVQNHAGLDIRDNTLLRYCEENSIAFLAHSPLGGSKSARIVEEPAIARMAAELAASPFQLVLAWLLSSSPALIPIVGARTRENAISSAEAAELSLSAEQLAALNALYPRQACTR